MDRLENQLKYHIPDDQKSVFANRYIKILREEVKRFRHHTNKDLTCHCYYIGSPGPGDAQLECLKCGEARGG